MGAPVRLHRPHMPKSASGQGSVKLDCGQNVVPQVFWQLVCSVMAQCTLRQFHRHWVRHGHELGSSMGWVGLGPKFSPMKWVGLGVVARN